MALNSGGFTTVFKEETHGGRCRTDAQLLETIIAGCDFVEFGLGQVELGRRTHLRDKLMIQIR
jgi:hypothetical protein